MLLRLLLALLLVPAAHGAGFDSPGIEAVTSWIGNSYGGAKKWVQQDIAAMCVMPDGTLFTNVEWDEAGGNAGEYRDGELVRYAMHTHGWGNGGGTAVAANDKYLFIGMEMSNEGGGLSDPATWPPKGAKWYGVSRRTRADIAKAAPFAGGKGGKGDTLKEAFLLVSEVPDKTKGPLPGICADAGKLYVADPHASRIKVYDAESMQPLAEWPVERAGPLALAPSGRLWMLQRKAAAAPAQMRCMDPAKADAGERLAFPEGVDPVAFCFDRDGRLLVADGGDSQQVRIFEVTGVSLKEAGRFGEEGGIASGTPGAFADRKFNRLSAIGCDARGNLYIAQDGQSGGGGTVLESYRLPGGELNWRLCGLTFVDMAEVDANDEREAFTKEERFRLDFSRPAGKEADYQAFTLSREKYPQDPRLHVWSAGAWVRQIGGRRILFVNDMNGEHLQVYRFAPEMDGKVAIPSGFFAKKHLTEKEAWPPNQPPKGAWIWRDANGNGAFDATEYQSAPEAADAPASQGWWVDRAGGIWLATEKEGIRYFPSAGLDKQGNPCWEFAGMKTFPHPAGFREIKRLRYDAVEDVLYLGGTSEEARNQHWKPMGPVLARYDGWLKGGRKQVWSITLPFAEGSSGHESCEPMGFDTAGGFVFVPYTGASKTNGVATGRVEIFRCRDGSAVGHVEPGPEVGEVGLQDIRECLTVHRRADGEFLVMIEDDYKAKVVMYRIKGLK